MKKITLTTLAILVFTSNALAYSGEILEKEVQIMDSSKETIAQAHVKLIEELRLECSTKDSGAGTAIDVVEASDNHYGGLDLEIDIYDFFAKVKVYCQW